MYKILIANDRVEKRLQEYIESRNDIKENFAKLKKTAKFSGEPFENSLNNKKMVNYSKFSKGKLDRLKLDPRRELDAHQLHGRLDGKWSCWLGSNIRIIYSINDIKETITIEAVGTHKIY